MKQVLMFTFLVLTAFAQAASLAHGATVDCSTNKSGEINFFSLQSKAGGGYLLKFFVVQEGGTSDSGALVAESHPSPLDANCTFNSKTNFECSYQQSGYLRVATVTGEGPKGKFSALKFTFGAHGLGDLVSNTFDFFECNIK